MILMIDNYDSFTYNLVQMFRALGAEMEVVSRIATVAMANRRSMASLASAGVLGVRFIMRDLF